MPTTIGGEKGRKVNLEVGRSNKGGNLEQFLTYTVASALAGLLAGVLIGFVIRGARARRVIDSMRDQLNQLREQLSKSGSSVLPERPQRWTGTEVAAIIGAIGTLLGVAKAIYNSYNGASKTKLEQDLRIAQASLQEMTSNVNTLLWYDTKTWIGLTPQNPPPPPSKKKVIAEFGIDDKNVSELTCDHPKVSLVFYGGGPSRLNCKKGGLRLQLNADARLLVLPAKLHGG
jgi:hypothetical protein